MRQLEGFEEDADDADQKMQTSRSHVAFKFLTSMDSATQSYGQDNFKVGKILYDSDSDSSDENTALDPPESFKDFKQYFKN